MAINPIPASVRSTAWYTPSTNGWQLLPPGPITEYQHAQAILVGDCVVLITHTDGDTAQPVYAAAYDTIAGGWTALPTLSPPAGHTVAWIALAATDETVYLWLHHQVCRDHPAQRPYGDGLTTRARTYGVQTYALTIASASWALIDLQTAGHGGIGGPIFTGEDFLQPASPPWIPHPHPRPRNLSGHRLNPAAGAATAIVHGPVDDQGPRYLWTGAALIAFDTNATVIRHSHTDYPGLGAVWDPATDTWAGLPPSDLASGGAAVAVWTGNELLMWGQFLVPGPVAEETTPAIFTAGQRFTPGAN